MNLKEQKEMDDMTYEQKLINYTAKILMSSVNCAVDRIGVKYKQQLLNELVSLIQAQLNVDNIEPPSFEESQGEFNSYNVALNG